MRVEDAVTDNSGIWISLGAIVVIYAAMGVAAVKVLSSMARRWRETDDVDLPTPYGPPAAKPPGANPAPDPTSPDPTSEVLS
jgi:cytochrome d ubiquinol oxidase subunit I